MGQGIFVISPSLLKGLSKSNFFGAAPGFNWGQKQSFGKGTKGGERGKPTFVTAVAQKG